MTASMMDPVQLGVEALVAQGFTDVHPNSPTEAGLGISKSALSSNQYIWVEEQTGSTPHIRYSDRPTVSFIVYSKLGVAEATRVGRAIQRALLDSQGVPLPSGGIHRVLTVIRPYRQDLPGLPPGVGRSLSQFDFVLSSDDHWE